MLVKTLEELKIYILALQLATDIVGLIKFIPDYWKISEAGQIFRSSSSVHSNIAEGFAQRFYHKQFVHYLTTALGSSDETKDHLRKLRNDGYIKSDIANDYINKYKNLSIKILNFINYLKEKHNIKH